MKIFPILVILIEKESLSLHQKSEMVLITTIKQQTIMPKEIITPCVRCIHFKVFVSNDDKPMLQPLHSFADYFPEKYTDSEFEFEYKVRTLVKSLKDLYKNVQVLKQVTYNDYKFD